MKSVRQYYSQIGRGTGGIVALLTALTVAAFVAVFYLPQPIVARMIEKDIRTQALDWRKRVLSTLDHGAETFVTGTVTAHDIEYLSIIPAASDIYRFKLFDAEGRVFWSTRTSDIGAVNDKPYWTDVIAKGEVFYKTAVKPGTEIDTLTPSEQRDEHLIVEIYKPVFEDGRFVGSIEFYSDISRMNATFLTRMRTVFWSSALAAFVVLLLVVVTLLRAARVRALAIRTSEREGRDTMEKQLRLAREVQLLGELNEWLQSSSSLDELFDMVAKFMSHLLPQGEGSIYVYSNSRDVLDGLAEWNGGSVHDHIRPDACWGLRRGRTYTYGTSEVNFACDHTEPHDGRPYFCFPILAHGETVGLMHLRARQGVEPDAFRASQKLAQMCAEQISMAIANVRMRDELHERSIRDPLTGLFNRRHMTDALRRMLGTAAKTGGRLAILSLDVDHFKKFNDNFGHDAGDMVLRAVGTAMEQACDGDEIACRAGGEEFFMLLPGLDRKSALARAETLRKAVEAIAVRYGEKTLPRITISGGLAFFPDHGAMPQDLMKVADDALYDAKAKGRNQIVVAELRDAADMPDGSGPAKGGKKPAGGKPADPDPSAPVPPKIAAE